MTDRELIDSPVLESRATEWVNEVAPLIFKTLDSAGLKYSEDTISQNLKHGWMIGYATCWREVKGSDTQPTA